MHRYYFVQLVAVSLIVIFGEECKAQRVQWATKILEFSSQRSPLEFSIQQILGKPNVLPRGGDNPNAWCPEKPNRKEFVVVGFEEPMAIKQLAIAESFHPGALISAHAIDSLDREYLLFEMNKEPSGLLGSMFNFFMPLTDFKVKAIRINFDGRKVDGYFNIDAIAISDHELPVSADVNIPTNIRSDLSIEALGPNVNSQQNELRPLLSPDGKKLFFTRQFDNANTGGSKDNGDIWISQFDPASDNWDIARPLSGELNTNGENYITSLSKQGSGLLALIGEAGSTKPNASKKILLSDNMTGQWRTPVKMDFVMDPEFEGQFEVSMSSDRKSMVIGTQMDDSNGGTDLYVSFLQKNGLWSSPMNLGSMVNSVLDESSPYLCPDNKTLYFSSNGFSGLGGTDIFKTVRLDDSWKQWSEPENLGYPINTSADEVFFSIPPTGNYAYFSRFIDNNNADVFRVELPIFKDTLDVIQFAASFQDLKSGKPVSAHVALSKTSHHQEGLNVQFDLKKAMHYINISSNGYYPISDTIDLRDYQKPYLDKKYDLEAIDSILTFNQIRFESNDQVILEESLHDLNEVVRILKKHPSLKLKIASHTDNVGSHEANMLLSQMRGQVVLRFLTSKGIEKSRLMLEWFGETRPIDTNDSEDGRQRNRRVEFEVMNN